MVHRQLCFSDWLWLEVLPALAFLAFFDLVVVALSLASLLVELEEVVDRQMTMKLATLLSCQATSVS